MARTPSPLHRRVVGLAKLAVVSTITILGVSPALAMPQEVVADQAPGPTASDLAAQADLDTLIAQHDCSVDGFGPDVIPGSALVERNDRIQHVTFDDGWAVYTGDAPGALLAVCRADL
jgi:hypothetical protein